MSEQLFFYISKFYIDKFVIYILPFIPLIATFCLSRKFNSNKKRVNYQPKEQDKLEKYFKRILYELSVFYGLAFFISHNFQRQEEFKNSSDLINFIIFVLIGWFLSLLNLYTLSIGKKFDSIKNHIVILAAISIAIIMSALSETEDFILKIIYNLAYVSIPAFTMYIIQKQDSKSSNEKINEILDRVSNIEKEILKINEKHKEQNHQNYKPKSFWEKFKDFLG